MTTVALALTVLQASGRVGDLGIVLAANMVPTLALLLVGGAVADRVSRRSLLIAANLASAATMGAMAATLIADHYDLIAIAGLSLVNGAVSAFTSPALRGIVPELVEHQDLQRANALLASTQNTVRIVAPTVASIVVATAGGGWALALDALTYALAAVAFTRIPWGSRPPATDQALWRDLVEGWSVFRSRRWVVLMVDLVRTHQRLQCWTVDRTRPGGRLAAQRRPGLGNGAVRAGHRPAGDERAGHQDRASTPATRRVHLGNPRRAPSARDRSLR